VNELQLLWQVEAATKSSEIIWNKFLPNDFTATWKGRTLRYSFLQDEPPSFWVLSDGGSDAEVLVEIIGYASGDVETKHYLGTLGSAIHDQADEPPKPIPPKQPPAGQDAEIARLLG
jgi:hypothetical protein